MSRLTARFTLRGMMGAVAGAALALALIRWPLGPFLGAPGILIGLTVLFRRWGRMTWLRAMTCVCAGQPWVMLFALYLAWGSICWLQGYRPGRGPPIQPGPWVEFWEGVAALTLITWPLTLGLGFSLILHEAMLDATSDIANRSHATVRIVLIPFLMWLSAMFVVGLDPGGAFDWLWD